jgi:1,2-phenylacetyl-CoA epoxidase PaaB subunit
MKRACSVYTNTDEILLASSIRQLKANYLRMKSFNRKWVVAALSVVAIACASPSTKKQANTDQKTAVTQGTYGYDVAFMKEHKMDFVELRDESGKSCLMISPALQGRVMTSSANGEPGKSFGWINYKHIQSGKVSEQFNPYGGEERIWLGPEGGPFSIYFPEGKEQVFENWDVPKEIDTVPFDIKSQSPSEITFGKEFELTNTSGTKLGIGVERTVKLLSRTDVEQALAAQLGDSLNFVAYESENILTNRGQSAWNEKSGFLSIWLLGMFNPSEKGVVFIPYKTGAEAEMGKIVSDDYFGKVPSDRLIKKDGILFFKVDGKFRSKIGISPQRALPFCGSYDPENKVLTLLWCSIPEKPMSYVNSKWGKQDNPLSGDAINSYNDGPVADGSIMGPFYEIESSSPAALLAPGETITHRQRIFHISGSEEQLNLITTKLFNTSISTIKEAFK